MRASDYCFTYAANYLRADLLLQQHFCRLGCISALLQPGNKDGGDGGNGSKGNGHEGNGNGRNGNGKVVVSDGKLDKSNGEPENGNDNNIDLNYATGDQAC
jgi:hypothetical protein